MAQFTCNFLSYSLGTAATISVIIPKGDGQKWTAEKEKFPVLYLLHGGFNDYSSWLRYTSVERYAEEHNIAVVNCSVMNSSYRNRTCTAKDAWAEQEQCFDATSVENYFDFIEEELPEFVTSTFQQISTRPEDTYMAGLSMGGYGTILHGLLRPERFAALGFFSPMIFDRKCFQMPEQERQALSEEERRQLLIPELVETAQNVAQSGKKFPAIYIANGKKDIREFAPVFAKMLQEWGASVTTDIDNKDFGHEWAFWDLVVKEFIEWLPRTDYYKDIRGRV